MSATGLELLETLIGIIESEMQQSRAAEARVMVLQKQLEKSGYKPGEESDGETVEELKKRLEERDLLAEELEEELSQVSIQLAEVSDQLAQREAGEAELQQELSWKEVTAMREQLREKTELLERYRAERNRDRDSNLESLEEEIDNLNARYQQGRERISELVKELEERDRVLSRLRSGGSEGSDLDEADALMGPLLNVDEFELPLPPLVELDESEQQATEQLLAEVDELSTNLPEKEDTVEDLPAIPYSLEDSSEDDDWASDELSDQAGSQDRAQDS
jgi:hypothetical protein